MTNYEIAKKLFDIGKGFDEVVNKRVANSDDPEYANLTTSLMETRDEIFEIVAEMAKDKSAEQKQDLSDDKKAEDSLEEDVNSTRNLN